MSAFRTASLLVALTLGRAAVADAQTPSSGQVARDESASAAQGTGSSVVRRPPPRPPFLVFLSANGGYQTLAPTFTSHVTQPENGESRVSDTSYSRASGAVVDVGGGVMLGQRWGVGVEVSRMDHDMAGTLSGSTPHPFYFAQPRVVSTTVGGLTHDELDVHVQVRGILPLGRNLQADVYGGPSVVRLRQGIVTDFTYSQAYPFDAVTFAAAQTQTDARWAAGFNVGAGASFFFARNIGVGAGVTYSRAVVEVPNPTGGDTSVTVGGLRVAGGIRVRF